MQLVLHHFPAPGKPLAHIPFLEARVAGIGGHRRRQRGARERGDGPEVVDGLAARAQGEVAQRPQILVAGRIGIGPVRDDAGLSDATPDTQH